MPLAKSRAITSHDIARHAGVSRATVSVVLNSTQSNIRVSEETRQRVLASVAELGYSPHPAAQALRRQRSKIIGFVPREDRGTPYELPVPYLLSIHLAKAAMRRGYHLIEASAETDDSRHSDELVQLLLRHRVDGVIFDRTGTAQQVQHVVDRGVPVVQVMRPQITVATATVTVDPKQGIYAAVAHLVEQGHRCIAFIGHRGPHPVDLARLKCFTAALADRCISLPHDYVRLGNDYLLEEGRAFTHALLALQVRPTALFVAGDSLALGALRALYEAGIRVPDDMSLISYDDAFAAHLYPPLTSIAQPFEEVADHAVALLTECLRQSGEDASEPEHVVLPSRLNVRQSVSTPEGGKCPESEGRHQADGASSCSRSAARWPRLGTTLRVTRATTL